MRSILPNSPTFWVLLLLAVFSFMLGGAFAAVFISAPLCP